MKEQLRHLLNIADNRPNATIQLLLRMAADNPAHRILTGQTGTTGVASAGEIFDAPDFLRALSARISLEPHRE